MTSPSRADGGPFVSRVIADPRVRFLVVGGGSACIEFLLFQFVVNLGVPPAAANAVSSWASLLTNFTGHGIWSFSGDRAVTGRGQFAAYRTLALINVAITSTLIHLLVSEGTPPGRPSSAAWRWSPPGTTSSSTA